MSVKLGFWVSIVRGILDSLGCFLDSKVQDSGFHRQKFHRYQNAGSLSWGFVPCCNTEMIRSTACPFAGELPCALEVVHSDVLVSYAQIDRELESCTFMYSIGFTFLTSAAILTMTYLLPYRYTYVMIVGTRKISGILRKSPHIIRRSIR